MTKNYKAVLKSSLVMLVLFAVAGSGVAQAQVCIARAADATTARAEGITEAVGDIELRCRNKPDMEFGFADDIKLTLTVELNTQVTNDIAVSTRVVSDLMYDGQAANDAFVGEDKEALSDEGTMITWKDVATDNAPFNLTTATTVVISGLLANASMVGDGGEVTAVVRVNGEAVHSGALKLADVKTGLEITVTAASGVQCATTDTETAMITIKELLMNAIGDNEVADVNAADGVVADDGLVVDFLNIPEGVTVTVPNMVINEPMIVDPGNANGMIVDPAAFSLMLVTGRTAGVTENEDDDAKSDVTLSSTGSGSARYLVTDVDDEVDGEWVTLPVDFKWTAGNVIDMGEVDVGLHPVSTRGDAYFVDEEGPTPRFVESSNPQTVISVQPCRTTLLFPYVTNQAMFDTGLAITNTSEEDGSCMIEYSGSDAPDEMNPDPEEVKSGKQWVKILSNIAPGFQGYITATCGFEGGYGFAFITNGYLGESTLAQGYLAVCTDCDDD